jgi:hypothetical protein
VDATSHAQKVDVDVEIMHTETFMTHKLFYEGLQQAALQTGLHKRFITL